MTILFRYLAKEIFLATLFLLFALVALFALFDLIRELGDLGKGNYQLLAVLTYVSLLQPARIVVIFPVAALLGTMFAISRMSSQSELAVMRASGLSLSRLAGFAALIGVLFSLLTFLFGEFITPVSEAWAKRAKLSATSAVVGQEFRSGFWVKDDRSFVNIQMVTPDTHLLNMRVYEFDQAYRLASISVAKEAEYDAQSGRWRMRDVEKTTFDAGKARIARLPTAFWNSAMTPDLLAVLRVSPDELSLLNLYAYIDHLRDNRQNSTRYELAFWGKVLQPVAVIIMMLLAIPFAIQSQRAIGVGGKLLVGIMIGLGFYFLNQLAAHLTVINNWPPLLSASLPLVAFFLLAAGLLMLKEYATSLPRRAT